MPSVSRSHPQMTWAPLCTPPWTAFFWPPFCCLEPGSLRCPCRWFTQNVAFQLHDLRISNDLFLCLYSVIRCKIYSLAFVMKATQPPKSPCLVFLLCPLPLLGISVATTTTIPWSQRTLRILAWLIYMISFQQFSPVFTSLISQLWILDPTVQSGS